MNHLATAAAAAVSAGAIALAVALEPGAATAVRSPGIAPLLAAPAPSATKPAFDFSSALPPAPLPTAIAPAETPAQQDLWQRIGDRERKPDLRNVDMGDLRATGDPRAVDVLLGIATDPAEDEVMRSWAVQHLGMAWELMDDRRRARVRATLAQLVAQPTETDLPAREALYALSRSEHAEERALASAAVDAGLGDEASSRLDLLVRLAGELQLTQHRARAAALTTHPSIAVAGAAREAVDRLAPGDRR